MFVLWSACVVSIMRKYQRDTHKLLVTLRFFLLFLLREECEKRTWWFSNSNMLYCLGLDFHFDTN